MAADKADKASEKQSLDKAKALDTALAQIERQFGKGSVMKMGDRGPQVMEVIPTGSIALDIALG
ncbi:MAG: DNA recombination/repair protein RecA, partial [Actinomycetes bacterium]